MTGKPRYSQSEYVCGLCRLPLQRNKGAWRHAVNATTKHRTCGTRPVPVKRGSLPLEAGQKLTVWRPAGVVTIGREPYRQRFRQASFDYLKGTATALRHHGEVAAYAVITAVEVASDGSGVLLHMEVIDQQEEAA